ncbi:unnamed protein product [Caenorhabditis angaria]|uniref:Uncharacterized protein n=1 Tax=Caenorhabditis angaria TaxID=860376 RepID=A0A9P1IFR2_9PELO|nr:unnamed protein product [Caenorhabditis angaria]
MISIGFFIQNFWIGCAMLLLLIDKENFEENQDVVKERLISFDEKIKMDGEEMRKKEFQFEEMENKLIWHYTDTSDIVFRHFKLDLMEKDHNNYQFLINYLPQLMHAVENQCYQQTDKTRTSEYSSILKRASELTLIFIKEFPQFLDSKFDEKIRPTWKGILKQDRLKLGRITNHNVGRHFKSSAFVMEKMSGFLRKSDEKIMELNRLKIKEAIEYRRETQTLLATVYIIVFIMTMGHSLTSDIPRLHRFFSLIRLLSYYSALALYILVCLGILDYYPKPFDCKLDFEIPQQNYSNFNGDLMELRTNMLKCDNYRKSIFGELEIDLDWYRVIGMADEYRATIRPHIRKIFDQDDKFPTDRNEYIKMADLLKEIRNYLECGYNYHPELKRIDKMLSAKINQMEHIAYNIHDIINLNEHVYIAITNEFNYFEEYIRTNFSSVNAFLGNFSKSCGEFEDITTKRTRKLCDSIDFMSDMRRIYLPLNFVFLMFTMILYSFKPYN